MNVIETSINGVKILEPQIFFDDRGYFYESFNQQVFIKQVCHVNFVQDNESYSKFGVVRALHFQKPPYAQSKLVRCISGEVFDVAVDVRKGSPTFGRWVGCRLTSNNHRMFFIPKGFAHGFSVLSEDALVLFKCDNYYHPESEVSIAWNDPYLNINWNVKDNDVILSNKDIHQPLFREIDFVF